MSYRDAEIMGDVGFGLDQFPSSYSEFNPNTLGCSLKEKIYVDPYIPIENEPMGSSYSKYNFDSSDNGTTNYPYNPLTYKTNSRSYLDSWNSINEYFNNKHKKKINQEHYCEKPNHVQKNKILLPFDNTLIIIIFIFIIIIILAYMQHKQSDNLQKIIEILIKNKSIR